MTTRTSTSSMAKRNRRGRAHASRQAVIRSERRASDNRVAKMFGAIVDRLNIQDLVLYVCARRALGYEFQEDEKEMLEEFISDAEDAADPEDSE